MAYILGYITADGCIAVSKDRRIHPFTLNITSVDREHLYKIRRALKSEHKVGVKGRDEAGHILGYQLQIRNPVITNDLVNLGIAPNKTNNLGPLKIPRKYFTDFTRGFFDGDGSVYIYLVNNTPQIKASFVSASFDFINYFNKELCASLDIPTKSIQIKKDGGKRHLLYCICFYIDDCVKLAQFMYGHNPTLYLDRKYRIFKKWKSVKRRGYLKQNYPTKIGWRLNFNNFPLNKLEYK